jgi:hypothetical protein
LHWRGLKTVYFCLRPGDDERAFKARFHCLLACLIYEPFWASIQPPITKPNHREKIGFVSVAKLLRLEPKVESRRADKLAAVLPLKFFTKPCHTVKHSRILFALPVYA